MTNPPGSALTAPDPEPRKPAPLTESVSVAVAAQAKAAVEARYLMAIRQPRSWLNVRSKLLEACHRPAFAASARYRKPIGSGSVEGASIRFAEEALRCMTNVYVEVAVMYEDETQRIVRVTPTDLEANVSYPTDIIIAKTVERKSPREGQEILGSRTNTQGGTVYIVRATEDELVTKQAAMVSKAIRTSGLRLLPSDIHEEAMDACIATEANADAHDPKAAMKKLADAFDAIAVRPTELERFVGHPLDQTSPAEVRRLRAFFRAIEEGETTWPEILALAGPGVTEADKNKGAEALREAVKKRQTEREAAAAASQPAKAEGPAAAQQSPPADGDGVMTEDQNRKLDQQIADREAAEAAQAALRDSGGGKKGRK